MKVLVTFEFSDDDRRLVNLRIGKPGRAGVRELKHHALSVVRAELQAIAADQNFSSPAARRAAERS